MSAAGAASPRTLEAARVLFAGPCDFEMGVVRLADLPQERQPEIAFAGRSNVGKSSLLNALVGRKGMARASNTPGRTQEINYFNLGGVLRLVDLPGYGYAKAARKDVERWSRLTNEFLRGRAPLRRVCLLVDSRHGLKPPDAEAMDILDAAAVSYAIVLTKADKIRPGDAEALYEATAKAVAKRPAAHPVIRATSAETGVGIAQLRADILEAAQR
jgi:GTP-binding protein